MPIRKATIVSFFLNRYSMKSGTGTKISVAAVRAMRVHSPSNEIATREAAVKSSAATSKTSLGISILSVLNPLPIIPHCSSMLFAARYASLMQA